GSGWAIFVEAQRLPANHYPNSHFPDPASTLVDAERRAQFEEEGAHFERQYYLTLVSLLLSAPAWMPSAARNLKKKGLTSRASTTSPWSGCRRPMMRRAPRPGSM